MTETVLSVKGLRAGYGKAEVLHGIDLRAPQGSVITVIPRTRQKRTRELPASPPSSTP